MSHLSILLNYYVQNNYLNLTSSISSTDLELLLEGIKEYNIVIEVVNVPKDFAFTDRLKTLPGIEIKEFL